MLYCALIAYLVFEGPEEDCNINTLVDTIGSMEVRENDENVRPDRGLPRAKVGICPAW